jgi:hypothetical protein
VRKCLHVGATNVLLVVESLETLLHERRARAYISWAVVGQASRGPVFLWASHLATIAERSRLRRSSGSS